MARNVNIRQRKVHQTPLEQFVIGYLKKITSTSNSQGEYKFLEKSIALINKFLGLPCCLTNPSNYNLITPNDNQLTNTIRTTLLNNKVIRRGFLISLKRILDRLEFALYGCCTLTSQFLFMGSFSPADVTVSLKDEATGVVLFTTNLIDISQSVTLPAKYFGPNAFISACLNIVNSPSPNNFVLYDNNSNVIVSSNTIGTTCGLIEPAQAVYRIQKV
jgi:hypothetical protein